MDVDLFVEQLEYSLRGLFPCCLCWCHRSDTNGICLCSDGGRSKRKHLDDGCNSFALCGRHFKFGGRIIDTQYWFPRTSPPLGVWDNYWAVKVRSKLCACNLCHRLWMVPLSWRVGSSIYNAAPTLDSKVSFGLEPNEDG